MKDNIKAWVISGYFIIGFFFAVYQHFWGQYNDKSFMFNLGQGLVWPAVMFPSVGKFIGGVLILLIIGTLILRSK
ncbi:MAG: hypothetical protein LKF82_15720 [Acinetobacter populi]|jgi:hypothetical protein|uniref:hypothetical protein n=1 Tax=Acinetobacter populi TaxID=1582270 RepID=UPI0023543CAB|nr:hypothetical protein [Acinetobacter populi]MCH4249242.1 hypothetical protein [Acinetobacter populi]